MPTSTDSSVRPARTPTTTSGSAAHVRPAATTTTIPVGDLVVSLELNPSTVVQHQLAKLKVSVSTHQAVGSVNVDYGDGATDNEHNYYPGFKECQPGNAGGAASLPFAHSWRLAETFQLVVVVSTCGDPFTGADKYQRTVRLAVPVGGGEVSSNGPQAPDAGGYLTPDSSTAMEVVVVAAVDDRDGYGRSLTIDWGDGSAPSVFERALTDCKDSSGQRYPDELTDRSTGFVPGGSQRHTYAAAGTYTITLHGTSTGCDGDSSQSAEGTLRVTVPCRQRTEEANAGYECSAS